MKEQVVGVLCYPYLDKYVIKVTRQLDRYHVPNTREYSARYTDITKVVELYNRFCKMTLILQAMILRSRVEYWKGLKKDESDS